MNDPVGWRDVTDAIDKLRDDLLTAIRSRDKRLDDHDDKFDDHDEKIGDINKKFVFYDSREDGIRSTLRAAIILIGALAAIIAIAKGIGVI